MARIEAELTNARLEECRQMSRAIKRWIVEQSLASNVGHIASSLSIADLVAALWAGVMNKPGTKAPDRDWFILSKGHAALTLYAAMRWKGLIDEERYKTYCGDGSLLGVHPECALDGVDLCTGSLGQGLSVGCGVALGMQKHGSKQQVFVLLSDAECNEGQVWEAAMFAPQHGLSNLTAIVDLNGLQALGYTKDVLDLNQAAIWQAFGWNVDEVDGHDLNELVRVLMKTDSSSDRPKPRVLIARTVAGRGVSFMEDQLDWHYRNLTAEQAASALHELEEAK